MLAVFTAALFLSACGGGGGGAAAPAVTLQSIAVTPSNPSNALNSRLQLTATGTYSDNTTQNITSSVTWSSANSALASVTSTGLVTPVVGAAASPVVLTASSGGLSASTTITLTAIPTFNLGAISDPLAAQQWGLLNTAQNGYADTVGVANTGNLGTDINVASVYSSFGYTGWGVTVAVIDSGLEIYHEDLSANVVPGGSWNFVNSTTDPTKSTTTGDHGTSVSGLIAMTKNGIGGIGVAPNAQLKGFNFLAATQTLANAIASLGGSSASPNSSDVAIFNQSYGSANTTDTPINSTIEAQYAYGTSTLRGGKGALYVKSAGNGFSAFGTAFCGQASGVGISCQNANFDPINTLPYNIVMAALNATGVKSSYSTTGSAIWVSAPGGEYGRNASVTSGLPAVSYDPAMVTTDQSTCTSGYSTSVETTSLFDRGGTNLASINASCNYTNSFNGTSSAAPMMTGAIALILEANPSLTWREVKDILARSAVQVDAGSLGRTLALSDGTYTTEQGWVPNHASPTGINYHNWYGFGAVNVAAAVAMASAYTSGSLGAFTNTGWITGTLPGSPGNVVPDNSVAGVTATFSVPKVGASGVIEAVQLMVTTTATTSIAASGCTNLTDGCTADIAIELTSPLNTKSILKNTGDGFNGFNLSGMVLASNAFYGEVNTGTWTVKVVDGWAGSGNQTITDVKIRVYGH